MSQQNGNITFFPPSPSHVNAQDPNNRSKFSYTREFLLSLADSTVKLPREVQLSISCLSQDATVLLSPPLCVPDSRCSKNLMVPDVAKVPDNDNHRLHRSNEPYLPPCRYKALLPSSRDGRDLLNNAASGSSDSTNQENVGQERWTKDMVRLPKEDEWHSRKNNDSKEFPEVFLMSSSTENFSSLQYASTVIAKQADTSRKPSLIQGGVRGDALQPFILPETIKNCFTQCQPLQDLITKGSVNLWQNSVNHVDASWHILSMLDNGMHLTESDAHSNFGVKHPEGNPRVMESLKDGRSQRFLSQKNCGNMKNNHYKVACEKGTKELPSICDGSPGSTANGNLLKGYTCFPIEDEKNLQGVKQATSFGMEQNASSPGFPIQQDLDLNSFSSFLDGKSNSISELCLPDEDSLITFDEPFLMPDVETSAVVINSVPSSERNLVEDDVDGPSSISDMIEKLVESVLDESSPAPYRDNSKLHLGAGLEDLCHSTHAQQSYAQFYSNLCNLGRDKQAFQQNNIDSAIFSLITSHAFPSNTTSQPLPLSHDELRRFDYEVSQSMFQPISPGKPHLCSLCVPQSGVTPHLPTFQMASCTHKLNSLLGCTLSCAETSYGGFIRPNPDSHGDSNSNQALVDSLMDTKLQTRNWHTYVGSF